MYLPPGISTDQDWRSSPDNSSLPSHQKNQNGPRFPGDVPPFPPPPGKNKMDQDCRQMYPTMDVHPTDSRAINPTAFFLLLLFEFHRLHVTIMITYP